MEIQFGEKKEEERGEKKKDKKVEKQKKAFFSFFYLPEVIRLYILKENPP